MSSLTEKHRQAMECADHAFAARREGNEALAAQMFQQAFENERAAAAMALAEQSPEPTLSVLHRSAATLALDCGEYREAERLIARALAGNPPFDIAEELRSLL